MQYYALVNQLVSVGLREQNAELQMAASFSLQKMAKTRIMNTVTRVTIQCGYQEREDVSVRKYNPSQFNAGPE